MRIESLYIYPIKSGPAVALESVEAVERGLARDRRFMVVDECGTFLSQRSHPALGRYSLRLLDDALVLDDGQGGAACQVPDSPSGRRAARVRVWSDTIDAVEVSAEADAFFSALLGEPARLVYMPQSTRRLVSGHDGVATSFADGFPVLVTNTASLADLNARIRGDAVPMLAFRPNVVVDAATPWVEDEWDSLTFGDVVLECASACERCVMTMLDPADPKHTREDGEPLRALAKFRRSASGAVTFGRNALVRTSGTLRRG